MRNKSLKRAACATVLIFITPALWHDSAFGETAIKTTVIFPSEKLALPVVAASVASKSASTNMGASQNGAANAATESLLNSAGSLNNSAGSLNNSAGSLNNSAGSLNNSAENIEFFNSASNGSPSLLAKSSNPSFANSAAQDLGTENSKVATTAADQNLGASQISASASQGNLGNLARTDLSIKAAASSGVTKTVKKNYVIDPVALLTMNVTSLKNNDAFNTALVGSLSAIIDKSKSKTGAKFYGKILASATYGWSGKQFTCLSSLWDRESHWNFKARNRHSGALGIAQANPASKMALIASDYSYNPITQIKWGLRYIKSRYSTPCKALSSHTYKGYY